MRNYHTCPFADSLIIIITCYYDKRGIIRARVRIISDCLTDFTRAEKALQTATRQISAFPARRDIRGVLLLLLCVHIARARKCVVAPMRENTSPYTDEVLFKRCMPRNAWDSRNRGDLRVERVFALRLLRLLTKNTI